MVAAESPHVFCVIVNWNGWADTLQCLVFNQTGRAPEFGGTHGTCLALDAVCTGRIKELS